VNCFEIPATRKRATAAATIDLRWKYRLAAIPRHVQTFPSLAIQNVSDSCGKEILWNVSTHFRRKRSQNVVELRVHDFLWNASTHFFDGRKCLRRSWSQIFRQCKIFCVFVCRIMYTVHPLKVIFDFCRTLVML
jgi:hypothetical protein